jgi:hypothetical protein
MNRANIGTLVYGLSAVLLTGLFYMFWKKEKEKTCCGCDGWTFMNQYEAYQMLLNSNEVKQSCIQQPNLVGVIAACLTEKISKTNSDYAIWKKGLGTVIDIRRGYIPSDLANCAQAICK